MSKPNGASLPYRPGVGVMLLNKHGQAFAARRLDMVSQAWQMPQGGMDPGETPLQAALRELEEEIGTCHAEVLCESRDWYMYDLPEHLVGKVWNGRYRGQRQKWFAMRFLGTDGDINIHTPHPEFAEWKWVEIRCLPELIVPFKRDLYAALVEEFKDIVAAARGA